MSDTARWNRPAPLSDHDVTLLRLNDRLNVSAAPNVTGEVQVYLQTGVLSGFSLIPPNSARQFAAQLLAAADKAERMARPGGAL